MDYLVCKERELGERSGKLMQAGDVQVGVFRVKGKLVAYANRCVHQWGPVCQGEILGKVEEVLDSDKTLIGERFSEDEIHLACPWHGWEYNLATGECAADRRLRLRSYPVMLRGDDVYVTV